MLAPTPMLRPSPLDISGLFAGTFEALKRRFGLFVLLTLFPVALGVVLIIIGVAILVTSTVVASIGTRPSLPAGFFVGISVYFLGILVAGLGQLKSYAMMSVGAYEIAQGQRPDFRGLLARTRGFLPRMASVIALAIGCFILVFGAFFALIGGSLIALADGGRSGRGSAAIAGLLGVIVLSMILLIPLTYFLTTKLLYTIPATAIEGVGGIEGMRRSWRLTKGAFWRTLGYYLVVSIAISLLSSTISGVGQFAMTPMLATIGSAPNSSDPGAGMVMLGAMIPFFIVMFILILGISILSVPFLQTYVTYMYVDQVRRSEMPAAAPGYGYPQPGYYAPPGQYYGQPGQYYAQPGQPGHPGQPYGPTGTGYPHPGQVPPQQPGTPGQQPPAPPAS